MINYYCDNCNIKVETSECPVCGERSKVTSKMYWCTSCNCPSYYEVCNVCGEQGVEIGSDVRPVFPEERLLIEIILGEPLLYLNSSVWSIGGGRYVIDGHKKIIRISDLSKLDEKKIISVYERSQLMNNYNAFNKYAEIYIKVNRKRFEYIDSEALRYISNEVKKFSTNDMFVSFSGGKDSTVTSDLVMRALGTPQILHVFGDTTLEFPETIEYVKKFKKNHPMTPIISAKNEEKNFEELCTLIGPPSRVMRWCCTIFKTGAITKKIDTIFKNKNKVLSFHGIRRMESASRKKYDRESQSPKITKQTVISPIIDWSDFDVWLYILSRKIDFNYAYNLGYARVGCWCCPNNSEWSVFLSKIHMTKQYHNFRNLLVDFAKRIGKEDAEVYVDTGKWKARQGGNGIEYSKKAVVSFEPCALEENSFNYTLSKPISEQLYEFFKPIGTINYDLGNLRLGEVYILDSNKEPILKLIGRKGSNKLKVSIFNIKALRTNNINSAEQKVKCQLTKFQMCLNCTACPSICKFDAISISGSYENLCYKINEDKCVHCGECINHFTSGCYMRKVLAVKRGDK
ncbi:MAG: phosphoadenosine phosphosulfate reductase family protein [Malacoplasma sp.]